MKKNNRTKVTVRIISLFIVVIMMFIIMPINANAETTDIEINEVNFPDSAFRTYVKDYIDSDKDNYISNDEILSITNINLDGKGVVDLKGIEYFTALKILSCRHNQLTSIDLSNNLEVENLDCFNNILINIDITNCIKLKELDLGHNQLTKLDLTNNVNLESVNVASNSITSIDVSKCTMLEILFVDYNKLTKLDVSNNILFTDITCGNNELSELVVLNNTNLIVLGISDNKITNIDVSNNIKLEILDCNNNQLKNLDVSLNSALIILWCSNNNLTSLDLSNNLNLRIITQYDNIMEYHTSSDTITLSDLGIDYTKVSDVEGASFAEGKFTNFNFDTDITYYYEIGFDSQKRQFTIKPIEAITHTITAITDGNGTITPNGSTTVNTGEDVTFTFVANSGYEIGKVTVDGNVVEVIGNTYTITKVTDDMKINVEFNKIVTNEDQESDAPDTGYYSNEYLYIVLALMSLACICTVGIKRKFI